MVFLFFISSGLFLGWSLGANDAANIYGTAVGSKMIRFRKAAIIASIFVVLGAVLQGGGTSATLSKLGAVNAIGGAFTVALCSAIVVAIMTYYKLPVSTGQAIVGSIVGWCYFSSVDVDYNVLYKIVCTWVTGPILGGIFGALLYLLLRTFLRRSKIHVIKLDTYIRNALIVVGAFGAYSLGANNVANVMGVFVNSVPNITLQIGSLSIDSVHLLFLLGGLAIAMGIITYSKRVMETVGNGILSLTPEGAIVVVMSQALVLFIFSSVELSNFLQSIGLPAIPLVPVSSTQVVIGSVLGIGFIRGAQEVKFRQLGHIALGWVLTPVLAGIMTFVSLFFMQNVFGLEVAQKAASIQKALPAIVNTKIDIPFSLNPVFSSLITAIVLIILFSIIVKIRKQRKDFEEQEKRWAEQKHYVDYQKALSDIELKSIQSENDVLAARLEEKRRDLVTYALNIGEQRSFLESICNAVEAARNESDDKQRLEKLNLVVNLIRQKMSFNDETEQLYHQAERVHSDFSGKLTEAYPDLTEQEKRLAILLRIGFSTKEIAPILNISAKSVEISRYRLRKKLKLNKEDNLTQYIKSM